MARRRNFRGSAIDERQSELVKEQEQLRKRISELQGIIEQAPIIEAEQRRLRQEEFLAHHHGHGGGSLGNIFTATPESHPPRRRHKRLRREEKAIRIQFALLLLVLVVLICILVNYLPNLAPYIPFLTKP